MNWVQLLNQKLKSVHQDLAALLATEPDLVRKLAHLTVCPVLVSQRLSSW